ncbi:hypothetical protein CC80DRAFT_495230 [Byssothecium circinans]|uniref:Uncharacterized protein n=1 Tax=Byssothecium circinans TaxID=147558 RepID=A0A6A5TLZ8_9PLEO|nr:hypothetical protein CC80DRAFT_495230 [Byssothecium circinans]
MTCRSPLSARPGMFVSSSTCGYGSRTCRIGVSISGPAWSARKDSDATAPHCSHRLWADQDFIRRLHIHLHSVVLHSRPHLIISKLNHNRYVLYMIIFTTIFVSLPTSGLGFAAQASRIPHILSANLVWDHHVRPTLLLDAHEVACSTSKM